MRTTLLLILALSGPTQAQPSAAAPLSGPKVSIPAAKSTLVEREFDGHLRRLEVSPAEAALALLALDEAQRVAVEAVIADRAAVVDKIVAGNLDLLLRLSSAQQADRAEQLRLVLEAFDALKPLRERSALLDELEAVLPGDKAQELRRLVREYRAALRADIIAQAEAKGERLRPRQAAARESLELLGQEIKRSYDRQAAAGTAHLEQVIQRLKLSTEQEHKVRNLVLDFVQRTMGKASEAQKRELFVSILAHLEPSQRRELLRMVFQGG